MSFHTSNIQIASTVANSTFAAIHVGSYRLKLRTITVYSTAATAGGIGWGIKGAGASTATTSQSFTPNDPRSAPITDVLATAWSAGAPAVPVSWLGRVPIPNVNGAGNVFQYTPGGNEVILDPSSVFVFANWTATAGGALSFTVEVEM